MQKLKLTRNLRRDILRGHPWIYQNALASAPSQGGALAQLYDAKGEPLAWVLTDTEGPLAARVLSLEKKAPSQSLFAQRIEQALQRRLSLLTETNTCFRLLNGEGDLLPGLVVDYYQGVAVVQFDGTELSKFWLNQSLSELLKKALPQIERVLLKARGTQSLEPLDGLADPVPKKVQVLEHGARFQVDMLLGQKTGFFLDQRDNRLYVRSLSKGLKVLNLFSYTGGFSINAGLGGAERVTSVDVSEGSLKEAEENWRLNGLSSQAHESLAVDIYKFLPQHKERYDLIIVDPPSMAPSEKAKPQAMKKYIEVFSEAAKKVQPQGHVILSSCSSHISFNDFFEIITESLSAARRRGQIFRVSGQGADHPFLHIHHEMRYLKFVHLALD